ncbi:MAG TPA: aromatic ring-hydroxylating dioxygenase subunit alpha [Caulobacteraceae bacterium]|nr:aromatic ring-hydroxylating dioxygenase subunit alpha [Caulobacteraceae bacterium]
MNKPLDTAELVEMTRRSLAHAKAGTIAKAGGVLKLDAARYYDPAFFETELRQIFRRVPLVLAVTAEMRAPGDFKTIEAAGVPVLIARGQDGMVRAFLNSCSHRGANVAVEPRGNARRFVCPYHGWTFTQQGELMGVAAPQDFGEIDKACHGLTELPAAERAGLIWVTLDPSPKVGVDSFLSGYDRVLSHFGFEDWHFFAARTLPGPNWKIAYDGYLDFYHLPVLHKNTFGENMYNRALYYAWGPHQRVHAPTDNLLELEAVPEDQWTSRSMLGGVWTIFPHVSIASFDRGGRAVMISQLLPGDTVNESFTTQIYLTETEPTTEAAAELDAQFKFLEHVVRDEDYATGLRQQRALKGGPRRQVLFGENEGGAQRFHHWVDRLIAAKDEDLEALFASV